jgi:hypothetical protein
VGEEPVLKVRRVLQVQVEEEQEPKEPKVLQDQVEDPKEIQGHKVLQDFKEQQELKDFKGLELQVLKVFKVIQEHKGPKVI